MWPYKVPSEKDCGGPSIICDSGIAAGNIAAMKLRHLNAHVTEALPSSGGQHGMSARSAIDISTDFTDMATPVAGTVATEMAIKAAKIARAKAMAELSGDTN